MHRPERRLQAESRNRAAGGRTAQRAAETLMHQRLMHQRLMHQRLMHQRLESDRSSILPLALAILVGGATVGCSNEPNGDGTLVDNAGGQSGAGNTNERTTGADGKAGAAGTSS